MRYLAEEIKLTITERFLEIIAAAQILYSADIETLTDGLTWGETE